MSVQKKRILVGGWHVEHYFTVEAIQSVGPKLRCYAIVKCAIKGEGKGEEGTAFTLGIDNFMGGGWKNARFVKLQEIKDEEYHAYDLGISMLQPGLQFYMDASDSMEAVYLDRIILVRDGPERLHERRVPWNRSHKSGI